MLASWSRRVTTISSPGCKRARQRAAEAEGQRRHVGAEDDLLGAGGVEEIGHGAPGFVHQGVGAAAGGERAAVVGVVGHQVIDHPVDHVLRHLGPAGIVQIDVR